MKRNIEIGDYVRIEYSNQNLIPQYYVIISLGESIIYLRNVQKIDNVTYLLSKNNKWILSDPDFLGTYIIFFLTPEEYINISTTGSLITGTKDVDYQILAQLDDTTLQIACRMDKLTNSICSDDEMWRIRTTYRLEDTVDKKSRNDTWKKHYLRYNVSLDQEGAEEIGKRGDVEVLNWFIGKNIQVDFDSVAKIAILSDKINIIRELLSLLNINEILSYAISTHNLPIISLLLEHNANPKITEIYDEIKQGNLPLARILFQHSIILNTDMLNWIAYWDDLELLRSFYVKYSIHPDIFGSTMAFSRNNTKIFDWLYSIGINYVPELVPFFSEGNYIDKDSITKLIAAGDLDTLQLLYKYGVKFYQDIADSAVEYNKLNILIWLASIRLYPDYFSADIALFNKNDEMIQWLLDNGYAISETARKEFQLKNKDSLMIKWIDDYQLYK